MAHATITLATGTIHNPAEPRHYMRIKPAKSHVRVMQGGRTLAETDRALRVIEVSRDLYDPVLYIPRADVSEALEIVPDKTSHCPLKGDASYLAIAGEEPIAWTYDRAFDFAAELKDHVAFYADRVTLEERGSKA